MIKLFLLLSCILLVQCTIIPGWPDALRCGQGGAQYAIFMLNGNNRYWNIHYVQVWNHQDRRVVFRPNGNFQYGTGRYDNRQGCERKSIETLKKEGRAFYFTSSQHDETLKQLRRQFKQSQQEIRLMKSRNRLSDFQDYEQVKDKMKQYLKKELLQEIQKNRFDLGPKQNINQEKSRLTVDETKQQNDISLKTDAQLPNNTNKGSN